MRIAYNIITYLVSPVYGLYWLFRGLTNPDYRVFPSMCDVVMRATAKTEIYRTGLR